MNDEFVQIHMDEEAGRAAGYTGAFGMGNLREPTCTTWCALARRRRPHRVAALPVPGRQPRGMTVCARGTVTAMRVEDGVRLVDLDVWTKDQDGNQIAPGKAVVELDSSSSHGGHRAR